MREVIHYKSVFGHDPIAEFLDSLNGKQVAQRLGTKKSAISRIENHAEDIRLSTLRKYAAAIGKQFKLEIS